MIRNGWFRGQAKVAKAADIAIIIHTLPTFPSFRGIKPFDVTRIFTEERFFALQFRIFFFSRGLISLRPAFQRRAEFPAFFFQPKFLSSAIDSLLHPESCIRMFLL